MKATKLKSIKQFLADIWLVSKLAFFISLIFSAFLSLIIPASTYEIALQACPLFIITLNAFSILSRFKKS